MIKIIFPSTLLALLLSGCFWYEDPWFGEALVTQYSGVPCFGLPKKEIADYETTKISFVVLSQGENELWSYSEKDYGKMRLAASSCIPYTVEALSEKSPAKNIGEIHGLKAGTVYRVLVRSRRENDGFDRTFYRANFCFRRQVDGGIIVMQLASAKEYVCPEK
ncbi:hypothetical protein [Delftia tsuruhatensis]|uniref:hypothetical protein n=1 Tax=Delftia tsuruhatensis TaxID=180282 RepID=UPI001EF44FC1|nr:hypothetical protein [Delftia tsuruhatensis]